MNWWRTWPPGWSGRKTGRQTRQGKYAGVASYSLKSRDLFSSIYRALQPRIVRMPSRARFIRGMLHCWLPAPLLAACAFAESVTLHPAADTTLFAPFPDNNVGANLNFASGANASVQPTRALMRFDLATQIPSNAVIQS